MIFPLYFLPRNPLGQQFKKKGGGLGVELVGQWSTSSRGKSKVPGKREQGKQACRFSRMEFTSFDLLPVHKEY